MEDDATTTVETEPGTEDATGVVTEQPGVEGVEDHPDPVVQGLRHALAAKNDKVGHLETQLAHIQGQLEAQQRMQAAPQETAREYTLDELTELEAGRMQELASDDPDVVGKAKEQLKLIRKEMGSVLQKGAATHAQQAAQAGTATQDAKAFEQFVRGKVPSAFEADSDFSQKGKEFNAKYPGLAASATQKELGLMQFAYSLLHASPETTGIRRQLATNLEQAGKEALHAGGGGGGGSPAKKRIEDLTSQETQALVKEHRDGTLTKARILSLFK